MGVRRSLHFVPGANIKMLNKVSDLPADAVVLDLEDSVVLENKGEARKNVISWLASEGDKKERFVRINPITLSSGREDLEAIIECEPDGVVLPKVSSLKEVKLADSIISEYEKKRASSSVGRTKLILIGAESAGAVLNLSSIPKHSRVDGLTWGVEDFFASIGSRSKRDSQGQYLEVFKYVRSMCLISAVSARVQPIDAVFSDIADQKKLAEECKASAQMGFTGKLTVHPNQISIVNEFFSPGEVEVDNAIELVSAFAENMREGKMAFLHKGKMVDAPHLERAKKILELSKEIAKRDS
ncbi:MAG: CoA ester lyase [Gammaproteobacteria bacterium]|nr:CoA ester lyase [Gammaproteobacteria bacterium]